MTIKETINQSLSQFESTLAQAKLTLGEAAAILRALDQHRTTLNKLADTIETTKE